MFSLKDLLTWIYKPLKLILRLFFPSISGQSTAMTVPTLGSWIDITFTSSRPVQLVKATWDWTGKNVWLDRDGQHMTVPENQGVTSYEFHFGDAPPDVDTQVFGFTATGFDSGDYFKFTMDLDRNESGDDPFTNDYLGGKLKLEFSDGTIIEDVFDAAANEPYGVKSEFSAIWLSPPRLQPTKPAAPLAESGV
jgi:hypothetical protein